ncbi:NAD(P)/FAD-dependent oxidoreductase [Acinetobacter pseudolwoffii]|uniref:NAD(P)/FAD-dependent oxidoreductase n=1 Tax=Acinetobacter pseudolwoffii TaxID=2053287 RepID=UPI002468E11C|nr:FAD-binding oxidoreductase [Acinetobacter pseudolwoffii]MDH5821157.1 FAD-binding oxidoreductase [Acinetobacter pseudolwoffii]
MHERQKYSINPDPYWWNAAPLPEGTSQLPSQADVLIVGSGITAMSAAITLLKNGRKVTVIDQNKIGSGASRRNAGYVSRSFKHSFADLEKKYGLDYAIKLHRELDESVRSVQEYVDTYKLDCDLKFLGRLLPVPNSSHFKALEDDLAKQKRYLGFEYEMLDKTKLQSELATDSYHGAALIPDLGGIHPGKYHAGLLKVALSLGLEICEEVKALEILSSGDVKQVNTTKGVISAKELILATNGYTDLLFPWLRRRIIPFDAYMIATEELPETLVKKIIPNNRVVIDTSHNPLFVRQSPDGNSILFGGLTATKPGSFEEKGEHLAKILRRLLPDLADKQLAHSWTGKCSGTFDLYPHAGQHEGIYYSLGYCFVGVPMGTYLGKKLALNILGQSEGKTLFFNRKFPTIPFYREKPWFLSTVFKYYDHLDKGTPAYDFAYQSN